MRDDEARSLMLRKLVRLAERLPNGLLFRLVEDAQFFYDWNLKKKHARASARLKQGDGILRVADEKHWEAFRKRFGS